MREFWVASGHHMTRLDAAGRMQVTDELILAWLARPEILPPPEACAAERVLHARLMAKPRAAVSVMERANMADPDARENWDADERGSTRIITDSFLRRWRRLETDADSAVNIGCDDPRISASIRIYPRPIAMECDGFASSSSLRVFVFATV